MDTSAVVSSDMRNYLGVGAAAGQKIDLYAGIKVGEGKFVEVGPHRVVVKGTVKVLNFEGELTADLLIKGPNLCRIELKTPKTTHVDEKATYTDKGNSREVYCKLFPDYFDEISAVFWRDRKYSNIRIWGKKLGAWIPILHVWAHPSDVALDVPFDITQEPLRPSAGA